MNKMEKHLQYTDEEFEALFDTCSLLPEDITHEAHIRLAWIHIRKYGLNVAELNIIQQLQKYVRFLGAEDKFNHTLTVAATKAVHHFIGKSTSTTFTEFIAEFPRLKSNFKDLMAQHYGFDIYHSQAAKASFLEPDLLAFD